VNYIYKLQAKYIKYTIIIIIKIVPYTILCTPLICTAFGRDSEVHISEACL